MPFVEYHEQPTLRNPVLIAALAGWNDAADSATTVIKYLTDRWKPMKLADIDPEEFYVFTETRPTIRVVEGIQHTVTWPINQFSAFEAPELDHDIILYQGVEPQLKWKTFSANVLEICQHFEVSEVILLGALLADIPHSMNVPINGSSSSQLQMDRLRELNIHSSRYKGPTGMIGVLQDVCRKANIPVVSLWAAAPHYLAATPNIKVTAELLRQVNNLLLLDLDLSELQAEATRFEEQISALVARDPEASAYVRKLEEQINELAEADDDEDDEDDENPLRNPDKPIGTGPLPSADALIRSVEELLRKERENGSPEDDEGQEEI